MVYSVKLKTCRAWAVFFITLAYGLAFAEYPDKTIRIITAEAGGGSDFASRLIAPALASALGQQVMVDNRGLGLSLPMLFFMGTSHGDWVIFGK